MYSVLYVLCSIPPGTYMYSNSASGYMCVPSLSTFGEVDPFCIPGRQNTSYKSQFLPIRIIIFNFCKNGTYRR